jgi:uncharacterized protein (TIGR03083 family)
METSEAYEAVRGRMLALATGADPTTPVPACPEWTVRELLAHVTGVAADVLAGNLAEAGTQPWVDAQLAARADATIDDLADEWRTSGPQVDEICAALGDAIAQLIFDSVTHEQDLRGALAAPGGRDGALDIALGWATTAWAEQEGAAGGLRLRADAVEVTLGDGDVVATLSAEPFEALRALTGRRSLDQVRALQWDGDPEPWLRFFTWGPFQPSVVPVTEG